MNTAQEAYDAIKKLEADNIFPLATPAKTVHVGNFNAATGKFQYEVHTITVIETDTGREARDTEVSGGPDQARERGQLTFAVFCNQSPGSVQRFL